MPERGSERMGRIFEGSGGLSSLVLWEQKTLGGTGPRLRVPAGGKGDGGSGLPGAGVPPFPLSGPGRIPRQGAFSGTAPVPRCGCPSVSISARAMTWTGWHLQRLCSDLTCKEPSTSVLGEEGAYLSARVKNWSFGLLGQSSPLPVAWRDPGCCLGTLSTGLPPGVLSPTSSPTPARLQRAEQEQRGRRESATGRCRSFGPWLAVCGMGG